MRFLALFHNPLIYVLLAAAVAAGILAHTVDAAVIAAVVLLEAGDRVPGLRVSAE